MTSTPPEPPPFFNGESTISAYGTRTECIGEGTYGTIVATNHGFAIKTMSLDADATISVTSLNEIVCASSIHHPNIIRYYDVFTDATHVHIVMDRLEGSLRGRVFEGEAFRRLAYQLVTTVAYLTSRGIIHRDINPSNILYRTVNGEMVPILGDFGLSTRSQRSTTHAYTSIYRPPEVMFGLTYDAKADVWALGATLYELYTGQFLFPILHRPRDLSESLALAASMVSRLTIPSSMHDLFWNLLEDGVRRDHYFRGRAPGETTSSYRKHVMAHLHAWIQRGHTSVAYDALVQLATPERPPLVPEPGMSAFLMAMLHPDPTVRTSIFELQSHPYFEGLNVNPVHPVPEQTRLYAREENLNIEIPDRLEIVRLLLKAKTMYNLSDASMIMGLELCYRYFTRRPYRDTVYACSIALGALNIAVRLVENTAIPLMKFCNIAYSTRITRTVLQERIDLILRVINWDGLATTTYDRIAHHPGAGPLLVALCGIPSLYFRADVDSLLVRWVQSGDSELKSQVTQFYAENTPMLAFLDPRLGLCFATRD